MKKMFEEMKFLFEGLFLFVFVTESTIDFFVTPSFLTFPDFFFGVIVYLLYRLTVNILTVNIDKLTKAKKKRMKMEKKRARINGKKGP